MKKNNRFINILLISFAVIFIAAAGIGEAWAYFTTYATAQGGYTIHLGYETVIEESYLAGKKSVEISNEVGSEPVYIRVKAFSGEKYELEYEPKSDSWRLDQTDGYWYYDEIVYGGDKTAALKVEIKMPKKPAEDELEFNVVVIYESTPVKYKADGTPYADWEAKLDTGEWEGGNKR